METFFDVSGLSAVLSTFLSKLISTKSLIMQPALRIKKAPITKYTYQYVSSALSCGRLANANQHGHINNKKPIGLSNLIRSHKFLIFFWNYFIQHNKKNDNVAIILKQ